MDSPLKSILMGFHITMAGMQVMAFIGALLVRSYVIRSCAMCRVCFRFHRERGWTLICVSFFLMALRRVVTALMWAGVFSLQPWRYVAWVGLPLLITVLFLLALYHLLMCEMTKSSAMERQKWTSS